MVLSRFVSVLSVAVLSSTAAALRARKEADPCACKNWKETYESAAVRCGKTNEFYQTTKHSSLTSEQVDEAFRFLGEQFCTQFFEAIDDNACVNMMIDEDRGQWCYVDAACGNLTGGETVNSQVSWKKCTAGQDKMLRDFKPFELLRLAQDNQLELGLTNKMAYKVSPYRWKYISAFWEDADLDYLNFNAKDVGMTVDDLKDSLKQRWGKRHREIDEEMVAELQGYVDSGLPVTFDTAKDKHPPHVIIQGRSVYIVVPSAKPTMICLTGCSK